MFHAFACDECDGEGREECSRCGSKIKCEDCGGTGLDDELIDAKAFGLAKTELLMRSRRLGCGYLQILLHGNENIGYESKFGQVRFADFSRAKEAEWGLLLLDKIDRGFTLTDELTPVLFLDAS